MPTTATTSPTPTPTLCVHAGIAAADAICCARLGEMARGEDHRSAIDLVGKVDKALANDLGALLGMKTRAGYDHTPISGTDRKRALRVANRLVAEARRVAGPLSGGGPDPRARNLPRAQNHRTNQK